MRHGYMDMILKKSSSSSSLLDVKKVLTAEIKQDKSGQLLKSWWEFFNSKDSVHHEFLLKDATVSKGYCLEVMKHLHKAIRKRSSAWKPNQWVLHADIAPTHLSLLIHQVLVKNKTTVISHTPFSPDFAQVDILVFFKLKMRL